ncbi:MAG: hypothetical protein EA400_00765 [Chromatiaceae bacterium]|nr:MAG: hypothetical protein EA400_00765 [Chromatiaceae bacterium]
MIGLGYGIAALVGLPLFGDGGHYFVMVAMDGAPLISQGRVGAALLQVPALLAWRLTDDLLLLRHAFAFGYVLIPWLSLCACWWLVRARAPWLLLFALLSLLALQINFSAVSELLASLALAWPLALALWCHPDRDGTWAYGLVLAPLLVLLHPLGFLVAWVLALSALAVAYRGSAHRALRWLAAWFGLAGLVRLGWTLVGSTSYERGRLQPESATHYLLPDSSAQLALLALVALLGLLLMLGLWRARSPAVRRWLAPVLLGLGWFLPLLALLIGAEFLVGTGVKLKAALSVVLGLGLLVLASLACWLEPGPTWAAPGVPPAMAVRGALPARALTGLIAAVSAAILILVLARAGAWWTATRALINLTIDTEATCLRYAANTPYGLQWPWMVIIDDWVVPLNALVFRADPALGPIALLVGGDGCEGIAATGMVHFNSWLARPFADLDARFGPLRHPPGP